MKRTTVIRQRWQGPGWDIGLAVSIDEANGRQVAAAGHVVEAIERFIGVHLPDARVATQQAAAPAAPQQQEGTTDG